MYTVFWNKVEGQMRELNHVQSHHHKNRQGQLKKGAETEVPQAVNSLWNVTKLKIIWRL